MIEAPMGVGCGEGVSPSPPRGEVWVLVTKAERRLTKKTCCKIYVNPYLIVIVQNAGPQTRGRGR